MKRLWLLTLLAVMWCGAAVADKVYSWTDENGVVHFSDRSKVGAQEVDVRVASSVDKLIDVPSAAESTDEAEGESSKANVRYQVAIVAPSHEATIRSNEGIIDVTVSVQPEMDKDNNLQLVLDGADIYVPQKSTNFRLENVDRGEHSIQVQMVNAAGKVIASSKPITVYLHRASVLAPRIQPKPASN